MNLSFHGNGDIVINGQSYSGNNVTIQGGVVTVDGVRQGESLKEKILNITINGRVDNLTTTSGNVTVNGSCDEIETVSGSISCGEVNGSVETVSGSVKAEVIHGNVRTVSGSIKNK